MKILVVEDDYRQAEWICGQLREAFKTEPELINTEYKFRQRLDEIEANPPDIIVLDLKLRWTVAEPNQVPSPREVAMEGKERAGFRCRALLAGREKTKGIPVILYSVFTEHELQHELTELPSSIKFLTKDSVSGGLIEEIRRLTAKS